MGKYSPFVDYLDKMETTEVSLSFSVIEDFLEEKLPESAYKYRAWWSNEKDGSHVQAHSWLKAGWRVESVDFSKEIVKFNRIKIETPFLNELYNRVDFEKEVVYKFFIVFSLFEYALKNAGFLKSGNIAQPNWQMFARDIEDKFNIQDSKDLNTAVSYLFSRPVKKQIVTHGVLDFEPRVRPQNIGDTEWLTKIICGTRNNLFHGGKFRYDHPRDTELMNNSLVILENWAKLNDNVYRNLQEIR